MAAAIAVIPAVGRHALHVEGTRIVDRIGSDLHAVGIDLVAELMVARVVGHITRRDADDRRIADAGVDTKQSGEPLRLGGARLDVAISLAPLIIELTPHMDRLGAALEHRAR